LHRQWPDDPDDHAERPLLQLHLFLVISQTLNGANTVNFTYDNDNLLTQAGALSISRNSQNGLVTGTTLGVVNDFWSYNTFGEVSGYSAGANASEVFKIQYTRDKLGRITEKSETVSGGPKTYSYVYDAAGRLGEIKEAGGTVATYTYDSNGNRITTNTGTPVTATFDNQDRLLQYGSTIYTYAGSGELASKAVGEESTTYPYDELGNLLDVSLPDGNHISYLIDGRNRRIGKRVNNVLVQGWLYKDRLNPVAELDGGGAVVAQFVYGTKQNVPDYLYKGGSTYRIISDHLGSPRLVIDISSGEIRQRGSTTPHLGISFPTPVPDSSLSGLREAFMINTPNSTGSGLGTMMPKQVAGRLRIPSDLTPRILICTSTRPAIRSTVLIRPD
jgi:YD repeat-containing protein